MINLLCDGLNIQKEGIVCQEKSTTGYGNALLICSSARPAPAFLKLSRGIAERDFALTPKARRTKCNTSQRLRYETQIKTLHFIRLSIEMLPRRVEIEKQHYRKNSLTGPLSNVLR